MKDKLVLRNFTAYVISFFLIITILTALFIIPKLKDVSRAQHAQDSIATLEIEAELLRRYVLGNSRILQDIAKFPVIANAVLLSSATDQNFVDMMDNFLVAGKKTSLTIQNIAGDPIYQTSIVRGVVFDKNSPWFTKLLSGKSEFHFHLLGQEGEKMRFILSVPVFYQGSVEGVLSSEISVPMKDVFTLQLIEGNVGFKLKQADREAQTDLSKIRIVEEFSRDLPSLGLELVYVHDASNFIKSQTALRNIILRVLFIGIAISFTAFVLLGFQSMKDQDEQVTKRTYIVPLGIALLGIAGSTLAAFFIYTVEQQHVRDDAEKLNRAQIDAFESTLKSNINALKGLKYFYQASDFISRKEFSHFTSALLSDHRSIKALEWIPEVGATERRSFVLKARSELQNNFQFTELKNGKMVKAAKRSIYYPVYYLNPLEGNENALGFDLGSNPARLTAMLEAKKMNKTIATEIVQLVQDSEKVSAVLIFTPVFNMYQENMFEGFVLGVFRLKDIVRVAKLSGFEDTGLKLVDVTGGKSSEVIYQDKLTENARAGFQLSRTIEFAGRKWEITAAQQAIRFGSTLGIPLSIFLGGVVLSLFVGYTLFQLVRRREITEAVVVERTAKVRELSDAMEQTVEGVARINPSGEFTYVNESYAATCGYRQEELIGKKWALTVHTDDLDTMNKAYEIMLENKQVTEEVRGVRKDGEEFYKRVTLISRLDEAGKFVGHHCFMSDITERKQAELELLRSNRDLDDFAYIASHDLKEPLRGIHNHAKLFMEEYKDKLTEEGQHRLGRITYLSQRLEKLINDLLHYSRLGRERTKFQETDLNEIVIGIQKLMADQTDAMITLENKLPKIMCDKTKVRELFLNLITNGIKYNDNIPKSVAIGSRSVKTAGGSESYRFYVKDNGIGIDPQFHEDIFKIFKRLHKRGAYGGGTGSGLTFVKKIIEQHKGRIWVESEPGKGTVFWFTLTQTSQ